MAFGVTESLRRPLGHKFGFSIKPRKGPTLPPKIMGADGSVLKDDFPLLGKPPIVHLHDSWTEGRLFAQRRLAGALPFRVLRMNEGLPLKEATSWIVYRFHVSFPTAPIASPPEPSIVDRLRSSPIEECEGGLKELATCLAKRGAESRLVQRSEPKRRGPQDGCEGPRKGKDGSAKRAKGFRGFPGV